MKKLLLVVVILMARCAFGQGYSFVNFSQFPNNYTLSNSSNYTTGDGLLLCKSWYGTARCDATNIFTVIQNSAGALTIQNTSACPDGDPPGHSGKYLDWSSTLGRGNSNQIIFLGTPAGVGGQQGGSFWFCSTIPNSASFGTTFDAFQLISGVAGSRLSNYTSNGTSQGWNLEGLTHGSVPYSPGNWVLVVWQYVNGGGCADTTNFTDCVVIRLYNRNFTLLGTDYASVPAGATNYATFGNGNAVSSVGTPAGFHVQVGDIRMYNLGYSVSQLSSLAVQYPWDGILTPGHFIDWRLAGIAGGIPSGSWTVCATTACNTLLAAGTGATVAQFNAALNSAPSNQVVTYIEGTYTFTTGMIQIPSTGHVAMRGLGHGAKFVFTSAAGGTCGRSGLAFICEVDAANANITNPASATTWSAGLAPGSTQTTLASTAGISTTSAANPTLLVYSQCDTGLNTGLGCTSGPGNTDNGQLFVSDQQYNTPSAGNGCCGNGPGNTIDRRGEMEIHVANSIAGNVATLSTPIGAPNWISSQTPMVSTVQSVSTFGIENTQVIHPSATGAVGISFQNAYNWWIKNSAVTDPNGVLQWGINCLGCANGEVQSTYVFNIGNGTGNPYGIRCMFCAYNLFDNNTIQKVGTPFSFDGSSFGNVVIGSYVPNSVFNPINNIVQGSFNSHAFNMLDLYEANIANQMDNDGVHGTAFGIANHRNIYTGWFSQPSNPITALTNARNDASFDRYMSDVFGMYGTDLYHTTYQLSATCTGQNSAIFLLGTACSYPFVPTDTLVKGTFLRYGNYDTVRAAVGFCGNSINTGFSTTCANTTEAAASAAVYPSFVPTVGDTAIGQPSAPASWYYTVRPPWWATSIPFPNDGPEVTGGTLVRCNGSGLNTVGQYTGSLSTNASHCAGQGATTAYGGHANPNPAMVCAQDVMGMPPDGSGGELSYDPLTCFSSTSTPIATFAPTSLSFTPQNVNTTSSPQTFTLTNTGTAVLSITSIGLTGANSNDYFQSNNCPVGSNLGIGAFCTITVTFTPLSAGAQPATIQFVDSASDSPQLYSLSGTGVQSGVTVQGQGQIVIQGTSKSQ